MYLLYCQLNYIAQSKGNKHVDQYTDLHFFIFQIFKLI